MPASKSRQSIGTFLLGTAALLFLLVLVLALLRPILFPSQEAPSASVHLQLPVTAVTVSPTIPVSSAASAEPVVAASTSTVATTTSGLQCKDAGWYAQLGAFFAPAEAKKLARQVANPKQMVCIAKHPHQRLYRVLAGPPTTDRSAAQTLAERFVKDGISPGAYPQYWSPTQ